ncbi:MAG: hypothetical protein WAV22_11170 [Porticoccaceae bacterium]
MKSIKLRFERDSVGKQLPHQNRTSTDSYGAVVNWADPNKGRSYKNLKDDEEKFEAEISFSEDDAGALDELVERCRKVNIECFKIGT